MNYRHPADIAPPMTYRTASNSQSNIASFPPPVYYRDTFGLQPINSRKFTDSIITDYSDNDSVTTKSTVKTTMNIYHPPNANNIMYESQYTDASQSYQVEQILTNQVLILHARPLLILTLVKFGSAVQLFVFAVICIFFDGSPYYVCLIASTLFIINSGILWYFIRCNHSRILLIVCFLTTSLNLIISVALFFWTAYLIYGEDRQLRKDGFDSTKADLLKSNHIVRNTRIAMYSLHMIVAPIQTICCAAIIYILYASKRSAVDGQISNGYFFSKPTGHQTVLVPITLKQVRRLDQPDEVENTSIGVQTSGTQREL